jgi:hypothetical protein
MGVQFMRNTTLANALRAAAAVIEADESGEAVSHVAAVAAAPSLAEKVRDFLANDTSDFDWRSAKAIGDAIGATEADVEAAANGSSELQSKRSTRGLACLSACATNQPRNAPRIAAPRKGRGVSFF